MSKPPTPEESISCRQVSICVVNNAICCRGTSDPVVLGQTPNNLRCRPRFGSKALPSKREKRQSIHRTKGCIVVRMRSFFNKKGVKLPTMARLHRPSDHPAAWKLQISWVVLRISSSYTFQLNLLCSSDPSWQTFHATFQPPKQFSSKVAVVISATSHAENKRKVISNRSAFSPVNLENLPDSGAARTMSMMTVCIGAVLWKSCNVSSLKPKVFCDGRDWAQVKKTDGRDRKATMQTQRNHTKILPILCSQLETDVFSRLARFGVATMTLRNRACMAHQIATTAKSDLACSALCPAMVLCHRGGLQSKCAPLRL